MGQNISQTSEAACLGVAATPWGTSAERCVVRNQKAKLTAKILQQRTFHEGEINAITMRRVLQTAVNATATYGIDLCPYSVDVQRTWNKLDEKIVRMTLG